MLSVNERTTSFAVALAACEHKLRLCILVAMWRLMNRRRANRYRALHVENSAQVGGMPLQAANADAIREFCQRTVAA